MKLSISAGSGDGLPGGTISGNSVLISGVFWFIIVMLLCVPGPSFLFAAGRAIYPRRTTRHIRYAAAFQFPAFSFAKNSRIDSGVVAHRPPHLIAWSRIRLPSAAITPSLIQFRWVRAQTGYGISIRITGDERGK